MYVSELVAPLLIFAGRYPRIIAAFLICSLHLMIALTGNYTFLNMLSIVLCLPLLDDGIVSRVVPRWIIERIEEAQDDSGPQPLIRLVFNVVAAILILIAASQFASRTLGIVVPEPLEITLERLSPFDLVGSYGLFAVMTTTRPEIVFEGSNDAKSWLPYEFKYKVGEDLRRAPPWVEPHMPRLDWRLWFAAMEPIEQNPWVLSLVQGLLAGSPDLDQFFVSNPFPSSPPKLIRAYVYDYHFATPYERKSTGNWWRRDNKRVFLPPVMLIEGRLKLAIRNAT
jgi:hypothetical protein